MKRFGKTGAIPMEQALAVAAAVVGVSAVGTMVAARLRRGSLRGKTALITGGSRGLGLLIAEELAERGARIVISARDEAQLTRARTRLQRYGVQVLAVRADLERRSDVRNLVVRAREAFDDVDILVNNAGVMEVGPAAEMIEGSYARAMAVHFWAPLTLMQEVIPAMRAKGSGHIINISSIGGILAIPHMLPYCASKFALRGLSEGMSAELAGDGISVTTVCPGLMRTGSTRHALFRGQREREHALFSVMSALPAFSMSARRAARKIVSAGLRGTPHLTLTWQAKLASLVHGMAPAFTGHVTRAATRALPAATNRYHSAIPGHAVEPKVVPDWIDAINERAAAKYNEL
jgi:short-subunit dehydrogenase